MSFSEPLASLITFFKTNLINFYHKGQGNRGYLFFSVKDRNLFHLVDTIGNIFTSGTATSENISDGVQRDETNFDLSPKKNPNKYSFYFKF